MRGAKAGRSDSNSSFRARLRAGAAVGLALFVGLASGLELFRGLAFSRRGRPTQDAVSVYLRRFEPLRPILAREETVGYFCGLSPAALKTDAQALAGYYLAQYALAPVIVANDLDRRVVVGNFGPGRVSPEGLRRFGLTAVRNLGNGVFLLEPAKK